MNLYCQFHGQLFTDLHTRSVVRKLK